MTMIPDGKDWTWVIERRCPECGFDAGTVDYEQISAIVRDNADQWIPVLQRSDVRVRPNARTWSPLEYAAHVRDVFDIFAVRLQMMIDEDDPLFENWDQDATAVDERYNEQDPAAVTHELVESAGRVARAFGAVPAADRGRTGRRSNGSRFTVDSLARYFVHDPIHHLHDVGVPR
ncbi:MAG: DinB family protein [Rhodococcus sp.]|nr:DinB family protein [Rhodococcus sp. (in: high G+C Gram-positive bacteria)]